MIPNDGLWRIQTFNYYTWRGANKYLISWPYVSSGVLFSRLLGESCMRLAGENTSFFKNQNTNGRVPKCIHLWGGTTNLAVSLLVISASSNMWCQTAIRDVRPDDNVSAFSLFCADVANINDPALAIIKIRNPRISSRWASLLATSSSAHWKPVCSFARFCSLCCCCCVFLLSMYRTIERTLCMRMLSDTFPNALFVTWDLLNLSHWNFKRFLRAKETLKEWSFHRSLSGTLFLDSECVPRVAETWGSGFCMCCFRVRGALTQNIWRAHSTRRLQRLQSQLQYVPQAP